ncbi:hypothetical protein [Salipaludibacillus neizhouensis]|uniref:hypothetical protein n=1 Tax=Salipaludibacillus neizhouensis TaxID=885475 RepID=UPI0011C3DDA4|nr:hypothetical protein [Salipaludibacillus neizhouensis]
MFLKRCFTGNVHDQTFTLELTIVIYNATKYRFLALYGSSLLKEERQRFHFYRISMFAVITFIVDLATLDPTFNPIPFLSPLAF